MDGDESDTNKIDPNVQNTREEGILVESEDPQAELQEHEAFLRERFGLEVHTSRFRSTLSSSLQITEIESPKRKLEAMQTLRSELSKYPPEYIRRCHIPGVYIGAQAIFTAPAVGIADRTYGLGLYTRPFHLPGTRSLNEAVHHEVFHFALYQEMGFPRAGVTNEPISEAGKAWIREWLTISKSKDTMELVEQDPDKLRLLQEEITELAGIIMNSPRRAKRLMEQGGKEARRVELLIREIFPHVSGTTMDAAFFERHFAAA